MRPPRPEVVPDVLALDTVLEDKSMDKAALLKAIDGHVLAQGELMGTYAK